ncbi:hypothetical protein ACFL1P_01750 [Patescibacteria group bacterium]
MINKLKKFLKPNIIISILLLVFAIGYNLWLYQLEPTATIDPNDNTFQFALVDRTNTIWDYALTRCSENILTFPVCFPSYLVDHWVPNWAEGYSLPYFYSHIPQIVIVGVWKFISLFSSITLYQFYRWIIHFLLCLFPISIFAALHIIGVGWITAGIGALLTSQVSTDGLYGLDPPSFLWRGYGLSSQLFAMLWFPIAIAYGYRFFQLHSKQKPIPIFHMIKRDLKIFFASILTIIKRKKTVLTKDEQQLQILFWKTVIFTTLTTAGHLGLGIMAMLSLGIMTVALPITAFLLKMPIKSIVDLVISQFIGLILTAGTSIFFLSYWIIPVLQHNNYHNISYWDPIWKFNSYGWIDILNNLFGGALYDFGRAPVLTAFVLVGAYAASQLRSVHAFSKDSYTPENENEEDLTIHNFPLISFSFLFVFWLFLYFGRTTWGGLIDLIPGMSEVHLSRFIVSLHVIGMLIVPIGIVFLITRISNYVETFILKLWKIKKEDLSFSIQYVTNIILGSTIVVCIFLAVSPQTIAYGKHNDVLINQAIGNHMKVKEDDDALFATIRSLPPARTMAGRGGGWGKNFNVAETEYFMHLSTYGIPTVLWMPQTWSPNSDIEQYFNEGNPDHFDLYNMRWVAAPADQKPSDFWELKYERPTWKLYEVYTSGYFTGGTHMMTVSIEKETFKNIVHTWTQSDFSKDRLFPEITFDRNPQRSVPTIIMNDESTYQHFTGEVEKYRSIFNERPFIKTEYPQPEIVGPESVHTDMMFETTVEVPENCTQCIVVLKQTYHPNWRVTVDGESVKPFTVFPFFTAIDMTEPGTHQVWFSYEPSTLKVFLMVLSVLVILFLNGISFYTKKRYK